MVYQKIFGSVLYCASIFLAPSICMAAAALVIPVSGEVSPPLPASGELNVGDQLDLGVNAVVAVIHFRACEELELKGGLVSIRPTKVQSQGSEVLFRAKGDCPEQVSLVETDLKGAVTLMRGADEAEKADVMSSVRPRFLLNADRSAFFSIGIFQDGAEVARIPLESGRGDWPADAPDLKVGQGYQFALESSGSKTSGGQLSVSLGGPKLIVLRP